MGKDALPDSIKISETTLEADGMPIVAEKEIPIKIGVQTRELDAVSKIMAATAKYLGTIKTDLSAVVSRETITGITWTIKDPVGTKTQIKIYQRLLGTQDFDKDISILQHVKKYKPEFSFTINPKAVLDAVEAACMASSDAKIMLSNATDPGVLSIASDAASLTDEDVTVANCIFTIYVRGYALRNILKRRCQAGGLDCTIRLSEATPVLSFEIGDDKYFTSCLNTIDMTFKVEAKIEDEQGIVVGAVEHDEDRSIPESSGSVEEPVAG